MYEIKLTLGILVVAQINQLFEDTDYGAQLSATE